MGSLSLKHMESKLEILTNSAQNTVASTRVSDLASNVSSSVVNAISLVVVAVDVVFVSVSYTHLTLPTKA